MRFIAAALVVLAACTHEPAPKSAKSPISYASPGARMAVETSARVVVMCPEGTGFGTAVAISARRALTARHVVDVVCDGEGVLPAFLLQMRDGTVVPAKVATRLANADVAVLEAAEPFFRVWASPPTKGDPAIGARLWSCGGHAAYKSDPTSGFNLKVGVYAGRSKGHLKVSTHVVPGNSGGGVFDDAGRLVGIVSMGVWDPNDENYMLAVPIGDLVQ